MPQFRYVPILRWKRGERIGLQTLSASARSDVAPLFVLGTSQYVGKSATKKTPAVAPPDVFVNELKTSWGAAPFYLDARHIPSNSTRHPLMDIATRAHYSGLNLIPATQLNASQPYQLAIAAVNGSYHRGIALRVDLNEFSSIPNWIKAWRHKAVETDLILDLGDNASIVNSLGASIDSLFFNMVGGENWRTITIVGTSMPENFSGFVAGTHTIFRAELALWQRLSSLKLPYRLDYGDWTTVPMTPPPEGIKWGYPINVRYTLQKEFLICRGTGTTGPNGIDMDVQLRDHACTIFNYPTRGAIPTCWADGRIDAVASGLEEPSGLQHWVSIGVNRHIERTRNDIP